MNLLFEDSQKILEDARNILRQNNIQFSDIKTDQYGGLYVLKNKGINTTYLKNAFNNFPFKYYKNRLGDINITFNAKKINIYLQYRSLVNDRNTLLKQVKSFNEDILFLNKEIKKIEKKIPHIIVEKKLINSL